MKQSVADRALFGGSPLFEEALHVGRPNLGDRDRFLGRVNEILDRRFFTNGGPCEAEFEQRIAQFVGVRHCIAMCNATIALEIAIRAAGLTGEVIVPSFTFIATAHALQWQQITPVFCDIDAHTCTIDPARVEAAITPRTTGIIGVHLWGRPCDVQALTDIARRHNLKLLFDAAHAFGCTYRGELVGRFGDAEVFSFHATKFINSFEGGAVLTSDDDLAARVRLMKNFGFVDYDDVEYIGTNGKMTEVAAAMGLTSLDSMDEIIAVNRRNYATYRDGLAGIGGITLLQYDEKERGNYQYVVLDIDETEYGISRDQLQSILHAENVLARRYFYPGCHRMEPYRTLFPGVGATLPVTERIAECVLSLPTGTAIEPDAIRVICQLIAFGARHAAVIRDRTNRRASDARTPTSPTPR